jgi:ATP-dependent exoDNAse (exonuclease V) beta subunit
MTAALFRQLVVASAGSGKTFQLSSRLIELLARGAAPDRLLASTFTRKAAGEILARVLQRLARAALDDGEAAALGEHTRGALRGRRHAGELLASITRDLHRLTVGTLDSFFVRAARCFWLELGLPADWTIADDAAHARLREQAIEVLLEQAPPHEIAPLVRSLEGGDAVRGVSARLARLLDEVDEIYEQIDFSRGDPFTRIDAPLAPPLDEAAYAAALEQLAAAPLPLTKEGEPHGKAEPALQVVVQHASRRDWSALFDCTLAKEALKDDGRFARCKVPDGLKAAFDPIVQQAGYELLVRQVDRLRAMGALARVYHDALRTLQDRRGHYRFGDLTRRLVPGSDGPAAAPLGDLFFRLDAQVVHLLLDEFQDTSVEQWRALGPVAEEVLGQADGSRAAFLVADPKQSIYGWRGAEPGLVSAVADAFDLERRRLDVSWRSAPVVLDTVNRIFEALEDNPVVAEHRAVAREWLGAFAPHRAQHGGLAGQVRVELARGANGSERKAACLERAAAIVAGILAESDGISIGVLTRRNKTVGELIHALRTRGIRASEEGGNPLTDAAPVAAILALLRLADHPGDHLARYHVARTAAGELVGLNDTCDDAAAFRVARRIRRRLLDEGYPRALEAWAARLAPRCDERELYRLLQLVELAGELGPRAGLRPRRFVELVQARRVDDPLAAPVRVMTVHQAKGLEFDAVVLTGLDDPIFGSLPQLLARRETLDGPVTAVFPSVPSCLEALLPAPLRRLHDEARARVLRDALSVLYVGMTRARRALHVVVCEPGKSDTSHSLARLVRCALAPDDAGDGGRTVLFEQGDARWRQEAAFAGEGRRDAVHPQVRLATHAPRRRLLDRQTPSGLEEGERVDLRRLLRRPARSAALARGLVQHALFEAVEWIEELPDDEQLLAIAARAGATGDGIAAAVERFRRAAAQPAVRALLARASWPAGTTVERERRFLVRDADALLAGSIDRLVLVREGERVVAAEVVDFKTDAVAAADEERLTALCALYRPQLEAYRRATARLLGLPPARVGAHLALLEPGVVRRL